MAFLDNYETVETRIHAFYNQIPEGRITTELVFHSPDFMDIIFKASVWVGDILLATGHAYEFKTDKGVNSDSHVENCETSAIGRALANYDFKGKNRPSREEMQKVARRQQATPQNAPMPKPELKKEPILNYADPKVRLGEYVVTVGQSIKGKKIKDINTNTLTDAVTFLTDRSIKSGKPLTEEELKFVNIATDWLSLNGQPIDLISDSILDIDPPSLNDSLSKAPEENNQRPTAPELISKGAKDSKKIILKEQEFLLKKAQAKNIGLEQIKNFLMNEGFETNITNLSKKEFNLVVAWIDSL